MSSKTNETVIGAIAVLIGTAIGKGIVQYTTDKEFKKWIDENLYPLAKKITVTFSPTAIKVAKDKISTKFDDRPNVKIILLQLMDLLIKGVVEFDRKFEKRLFEVKDVLPEVYEELKLIDE